MSRTVDLLAADLAILVAILRDHLASDVRIWAFGSRATGTARRYSDLDLAVASDRPLDCDVLSRLREALSESDLTIKVDVVDLLAVEPAFRRLIEGDMIRFVSCGDESRAGLTS